MTLSCEQQWCMIFWIWCQRESNRTRLVSFYSILVKAGDVGKLTFLGRLVCQVFCIFWQILLLFLFILFHCIQQKRNINSPCFLGSRSANSSWEHDPTICEGQGWLVDQHSSLQQRTYSPWCHCWQNCMQEEPWSSHPTLPEGWAGKTAQLLEGD